MARLAIVHKLSDALLGSCVLCTSELWRSRVWKSLKATNRISADVNAVCSQEYPSKDQWSQLQLQHLCMVFGRCVPRA